MSKISRLLCLIFFLTTIVSCGALKHRTNVSPAWRNYLQANDITSFRFPPQLHQSTWEYDHLKIVFLKNLTGPKLTGLMALPYITKTEQLTLRYEIKFANDFDFVKGGKLPGLLGGGLANDSRHTVTGGNHPSDNNGLSARIMWRKNGKGVLYLYHLDQPNRYGEDFPLGIHFVPGQWYQIELKLKLNTPHLADGEILVFVNQQLKFRKSNFRFRTSKQVLLDTLSLVCFFGGHTKDWAPLKDEILFLRKVELAYD